MAALKRLNKKSWSFVKRSFKEFKVANQKANNKFSVAEKLHERIYYEKYKTLKSGADYKRQVVWLSLLGEKRRIKELCSSYPTCSILWRKIVHIPYRGLMLKIRFVKK